MTTTREAGQSLASAQALDAYMTASNETMDARYQVIRLQRELRAARAAVKAAESVERAADAAYLATPYAD